MDKVNPHAPELGDNPEIGTIMPVNLPIHSLSYARKLKKEFPEQWEKFKEFRAQILEIAGYKNIAELANRSDDKEFIEDMRKKFLMAFAFDENMTLEQRQEKISEAGGYGDTADSMVERAQNEHFPGHEYALALHNEIMVTSNVGKLFAIALDERWNDTVRFEAKRKLRYIRDLIEADKAIKARRNDLEFLFDLMDERFFTPNGEKKGGTLTKWLVTIHDSKDNNRCIGSELLDKKPSSNDLSSEGLPKNAFKIAQPIKFRTFIAKLDDGTEVKIPFMLHPRKKDLGGMVYKKHRKPDRSWDQIARDHSGLRLLADEENIKFFAEALEKLGEPNKEDDVHYETRVEKVKNGVSDNGGEKPVIGGKKFNLIIGGKDFEIQALNYIQYGNFQLLKEKGGAHVIYENDRYHDADLYRENYPKELYPESPDEEMIRIVAAEEAYQKELATLKARMPDEVVDNSSVVDLDERKRELLAEVMEEALEKLDEIEPDEGIIDEQALANA